VIVPTPPLDVPAGAIDPQTLGAGPGPSPSPIAASSASAAVPEAAPSVPEAGGLSSPPPAGEPVVRVKVSRRAKSATLAAAIVAALSGCTPSLYTHGNDRPILAAYSNQNLRATLPADVPVLTAHAAALDAARARGYTIVRESGTADRAMILARAHGEDKGWDDLQVDTFLVMGGTRVIINTGSAGNEAQARALLDAVLTRLGR
jgi:hypothetical protein